MSFSFQSCGWRCQMGNVASPLHLCLDVVLHRVKSILSSSQAWSLLPQLLASPVAAALLYSTGIENIFKSKCLSLMTAVSPPELCELCDDGSAAPRTGS